MITFVSNRLCGHGALFVKMGVLGAVSEFGGEEEGVVGKACTPKWFGLPLTPEKVPHRCLLYPCFVGKGETDWEM